MPTNVPMVFISSTLEDLGPYRAAAKEAALAARFLSDDCLYWPAQNRQALPVCMDQVDKADLLVAIVAYRYGWEPPDQTPGEFKSITWLEVLRARSQGTDVLVFLVHPKFEWTHDRDDRMTISDDATEEEFAAARRRVRNLKAFKQELQSGISAYFTTEPHLSQLIERALRDWRDKHPEFHAAPPITAEPRKPTRYLEILQQDTGFIDIRGLSTGTGKAHRFPIGQLYVPLTMAGGGERRHIDLEEALNHQRLVIRGDPGAGKTTFLRHIAHAAASDWLLVESKPKRPFPVLIRIAELIDFMGKSTVPIAAEHPEWLVHFTTSFTLGGLDEAFLRRRIETGECLFLLDGLDEAPTRQTRESIARLFHKATQLFDRCRFVVTTRPQAYEGAAILDGFTIADIEDLPKESVRQYVRQWCGALFPNDATGAENHLRQLQEPLEAKPEIRRLTATMVMLTALAVVHWNERRLPEQRADLYESILTWLARSREDREGRASGDQCLRHLQHLALGMTFHPKGRQVQISKAAASQLLTEPLPKPDEALRFLDEEEADSGIVVSRGVELRFWHLTFQEFLAARELAGWQDKNQHPFLLDEGRLYRREARETLLLLAGILGRSGPERVDGLIEAILDSLGDSPSLAERARAVGLIGAMVRDLKPYGFAPLDRRYDNYLGSVLGIFEPGAETIDFQVRLEAAEALGQAGDPRLEEDNRIQIPGTKLWIGKYPVTVQEYAKFVESEAFGDRIKPEEWEDQLEHPNRPVVYVSWYEASAYCAWAGCRLPTEAEWQRVAKGREKRAYPWGKEGPDETRANYSEGGPGHPTPVGLYPLGATPAPEGVLDMAGNVWEWCADWYDERSKALRGGSWGGDSRNLYVSYRLRDVRSGRSVVIGFRCLGEIVA